MGKAARNRRNSFLKDHCRSGELLRPPLIAAVGDKLKPANWSLDSMSNMLWLADLVTAEDVDVALIEASKRLDILYDLIVRGSGEEGEGFILEVA